jgi:hypothetical protein
MTPTRQIIAGPQPESPNGYGAASTEMLRRGISLVQSDAPVKDLALLRHRRRRMWSLQVSAVFHDLGQALEGVWIIYEAMVRGKPVANSDDVLSQIGKALRRASIRRGRVIGGQGSRSGPRKLRRLLQRLSPSI